MRPRVFPAEDIRLLAEPEKKQKASMRPRVFPAEDYEIVDGRRRLSILLQ